MPWLQQAPVCDNLLVLGQDPDQAYNAVEQLFKRCNGPLFSLVHMGLDGGHRIADMVLIVLETSAQVPLVKKYVSEYRLAACAVVSMNGDLEVLNLHNVLIEVAAQFSVDGLLAALTNVEQRFAEKHRDVMEYGCHHFQRLCFKACQLTLESREYKALEINHCFPWVFDKTLGFEISWPQFRRRDFVYRLAVTADSTLRPPFGYPLPPKWDGIRFFCASLLEIYESLPSVFCA